MKVTVLRENLKEGLTAVSRIVQKNLSLPILNSVLLEAEKNFLCLKVTDLEIGLKWWLLAKVEKEGKVACSARLLQGLVDSLPLEKLILKTEDSKLWLETEKTQAQINGQNADDFPLIPEPEAKSSLTINQHFLVQALSQVTDFCATSAVKPEIAGVLFSLNDNQLKVVATDSFRLAEKTLSLPGEKTENFSFILPQRACREILNIFGEKEEGSPVKINFSSNQFLLESFMAETPHAKINFFSRLVEGEYPDYHEIIPKNFKFKAVANKAEFLQSLKAVSFFTNKINEVKIKIDPGRQTIEFLGQNPEVGQSKSSFSAKIEGEGAEVSFNWRFLSEGLSQIKEKDLVFSLSRDDGPAILRPLSQDDYLYLLMPLRL